MNAKRIPLMFLRWTLVALVLIFGSSSALAQLTFSGSSGALSGSVTFDVDASGHLTIEFTNTSAMDVTGAADVLTALFFSVGGNPHLTPVSAHLADGSTVLTLLRNGTVQVGPDGGGNVGGEWAFRSALSGAPWGANYGIGSAGLGFFGEANFGGPNLDGPKSVAGPDFGIASADDIPSTYWGRPTPLIHNSVVFTLALPFGFTLSDQSIFDVSFQFGTSLSEPNVPASPDNSEPPPPA